jgi:hypothetical protein
MTSVYTAPTMILGHRGLPSSQDKHKTDMDGLIGSSSLMLELEEHYKLIGWLTKHDSEINKALKKTVFCNL